MNVEDRIQAAIVAWVREHAPDVLIFHVPNGGLVTKREAARRKWVGVVPGVPDLVVFAPVGRAFGLEVKAPKGRLNPDQRAIHDRLTVIGIGSAVVYSVEEAQLAFKAWRIPFAEADRAA